MLSHFSRGPLASCLKCIFLHFLGMCFSYFECKIAFQYLVILISLVSRWTDWHLTWKPLKTAACIFWPPDSVFGSTSRVTWCKPPRCFFGSLRPSLHNLLGCWRECIVLICAQRRSLLVVTSCKAAVSLFLQSCAACSCVSFPLWSKNIDREFVFFSCQYC